MSDAKTSQLIAEARDKMAEVGESGAYGCNAAYRALILALCDEAEKALSELVAALRLFHPNNATELFERAAEDFYKATRLMAPGKSVPLELAYDSEQEAKRQELWRPFIARWREQFIDAVLAKAGAK